MNSETLLIVDDEQSIREYLHRVLSREGFKILEASNGQEALDVLRRQDGEIHLVLMDISMPQMDGQTCARLMIKEKPQIPIICMSGNMDPAQMAKELNIPTITFLQKPFTTEDILNQTRAMLMKARGRG